MPEDVDKSLEERKARLAAELADRQAKAGEPKTANEETIKGYRLAVKLSSEFISAIAVGAFIGWGIDRLAGTWPWGLVIFLLLGFAAGVMNVLRSSGAVQSPHPVDKLGEMNRKKTEK